jgi:hypothetical protein
MNSPGVFADLAAQRACWHPVAFAGDVADRPVHADLLGEPLVIWRGADGAPRVMSESQRPERVPFDLPAELHLSFDAVAVACRKAMRELGLAANTPIGIAAE